MHPHGLAVPGIRVRVQDLHNLGHPGYPPAAPPQHPHVRAGTLCSLALEIIFVYSFKYGFMRNRPLQDYAVDALITSFQTSSFPSGHTAQLFCVATVFAVFRRDLLPEILLLAFLVALTRMYMYAHYPTDVLAGALIGIGCAAVAIFTLLRMDEYVYYVKDPDQD
ncbi:MAG: phosphatase PAP2 family protein [Candidatus Methanomethylophilus sp.]|nr:phosphatase PAP2 family protein [Methanomethylophilus sp.]